MVSAKFLAAFVAIIPFVSCLSLEALKETPEVQQLLVLPEKYPVITNFVNSVISRYQQQSVASELDLLRLNLILEGLQNDIVEFVNSPSFSEYANLAKEEIKKVVIPILAVAPMNDIATLADTIQDNEELQVSLAEDVENVSELFAALVQSEASKFGDVIVNGARDVARKLLR